ncbi:MAG: hypothetical protein KBH09_15520 [Saprospiraceae bacterium]|nr:hypothetical protein [Saprospiraceae bacterium]
MKKDLSLVLSKGELVLFKLSEELKDSVTYGNLYETLLGYESLSHDELINNPEFDEKAKLVLLHDMQKVRINVFSEWCGYPVQDIAGFGDVIHCQICGKRNEKIFYIVNSINKNELNVGSHCITKFPTIEGIPEQRKGYSTIYKNRKQMERKAAFYETFPDIENEIKIAIREFVNFPILLPWNVYSQINKNLSKMKTTYRDFLIKGSMKNINEALEEFRNCYIKYKRLWERAILIKNDNLEKKTICRVEEYQWLKENDKKDILRKISGNNGFYQPDTLKEIHNYNFISKNKELFNGCLRDLNISIKSIQNESSTMVLDYDVPHFSRNVELRIPFRSFMKTEGWKCVLVRDYKIPSITSYFSINDTEGNLNVILDRVNRILSARDSGLKYDYDSILGKLYVVRIMSKKYLVIDKSNFLKVYLKRIFMDDEDLYSKLSEDYNEFKTLKWKTQDSMLSSDEISRMMTKRDK